MLPVFINPSETELLGKGSFGCVHRGYDAAGRTYAVKCAREEDETLLSEFFFLRYLAKDPSVGAASLIECRGLQSLEGRVALVLPMGEGSLYSHMYARGCFAVEEIRSITRQVLCALSFLHASNIVHADLKPGNILLFPGGVIKVSDLGSSFFADAYPLPEFPLVSWWYRSPEVAARAHRLPAMDIWSFGIIATELYIGKRLFLEKSEENLLILQGNLLGWDKLRPFLQKIWKDIAFPISLPPNFPSLNEILEGAKREECKELIALIRESLQVDPDDRAEAVELLRQPFYEPCPLVRVPETRARMESGGADVQKNESLASERLIRESRMLSYLHHFPVYQPVPFPKIKGWHVQGTANLCFEGLGPNLSLVLYQKGKSCTLREVASLLRQMVYILSVLEKEGIIHGEIQLMHFCFSQDQDRLLLSGFRGACFKEEAVLTPTFFPRLSSESPEYILSLPCTEKMDVWALGIVVLNLFGLAFDTEGSQEGTLAWQEALLGPIPDSLLDRTDEEGKRKVQRAKTFFAQKPAGLEQYFERALRRESPEIKSLFFDLLRRMLCLDPEQRARASELLNHPFLHLTPTKEDGGFCSLS